MPMAMASPPSDIRFAEILKTRIITSVNNTDSGRISATVSAARRLPSNTMSTKITSTTASPNAFSTVNTAESISSERS